MNWHVDPAHLAIAAVLTVALGGLAVGHRAVVRRLLEARLHDIRHDVQGQPGSEELLGWIARAEDDPQVVWRAFRGKGRGDASGELAIAWGRFSQALAEWARLSRGGIR